MMADRPDHLTALALATFRANGALLSAGDALTAPFGLSSARWQVMGAVVLAGQPLTVPQIARNMGLSRQSVQRLIDELQKQEMVTLAPNPHHKRARLVRLSPAGEAAYGAVMLQWNALAARLAAGMDETQVKAATQALETLCIRLDEAHPPD